jgi:hypothetical protein
MEDGSVVYQVVQATDDDDNNEVRRERTRLLSFHDSVTRLRWTRARFLL